MTYKGVDLAKFKPCLCRTRRVSPNVFAGSNSVVVGTVGRMEVGQLWLEHSSKWSKTLKMHANACVWQCLAKAPFGSPRWSYFEVRARSDKKGVPEFMRSRDLFVLPSIRESILNEILGAMVTGVAIGAANVGDNSELVELGKMGEFAQHSNRAIMAEAIDRYFADSERVVRDGKQGREKVLKHFQHRNYGSELFEYICQSVAVENTEDCSNGFGVNCRPSQLTLS